MKNIASQLEFHPQLTALVVGAAGWFPQAKELVKRGSTLQSQAPLQ